MTQEEKKETQFFKLYIQSQKPIFNYILMMVPNLSDAEDILQEVSALMWSKFDEFVKGTNFTSWGIQIAYYNILQFYRKHKRAALQFDEALLAQLHSYTPVLLGDEDDQVFALRKCIERLDDRDQKLIRMRYEESRAPAEIAQSVNRSVDAVYKAISRIHNYLLLCVRKGAGEVL